ncbi:stage VI sporulation protein F [Bacillus sp. FJAT-45350]|uniref:stage VI sporulation protein F n=1 Tax=Bacillus sp. FJAT-45350 TaxID=2011014 RepID=UPI000BB7970F|nr:stage VI sporulation protein F [Bacillus sp. FJAT-45350]
MNNPLFNNIEKKTGVKMDEVMKLVGNVQNANFNDEATVRSIIKQVAQIANKPVKPEMEDQIVNSIINNKEQMDFGTIAKMLDNKNK